MNSITKTYNKKIILNSVQFEISSKCTLIIGENGSGKTTLFKTLSGLIKKFKGKIDYKNDVSLLLDLPCLFSLKSGVDNIEYFLSKDEVKKSKFYIDYFNMNDYINMLVKNYSNGMRKKLSLVIALSRNKKLLLLDEPSNGLDFESVNKLKTLLTKEKDNRNIIISSHSADFFDAKLIDTIYLLKDHKLYQKNIQDFDYCFYKIMTIDEVKDFKYELQIEDNYYYFKVYNNEINNFSAFISKYKVLEMIKLEYNDRRYLEGVYDD